MKTGLYVVFDIKAGETRGPVWQLKNNTVAIRAFSEIVMMEGSDLAKAPEDYQLHRVATLDTETLNVMQTAEDGFVLDARTVIDAQFQRAHDGKED